MMAMEEVVHFMPMPFLYDYAATLHVGGLARTYIVHLPASYSGVKALPLVLVFHGGTGKAQHMDKLTNFNALANQRHFIVVYPQGHQDHWADGRGTTIPDREGVNDVAFVSLLIDRLSRDLNIDTARVYVTGISNGGFFVQLLGCMLAQKIAAIGVVAATMPTNVAQQCHPGRPMPTLLIHGSKDSFVPAAGGEMTKGSGGNILSLSATVATRVLQNACLKSVIGSVLPPSVNDGTQVQLDSYVGCRANADVLLYNIIGGGHTWPGGYPYLPHIVGKTSRNLNATLAIWEFFQAHPM